MDNLKSIIKNSPMVVKVSVFLFFVLAIVIIIAAIVFSVSPSVKSNIDVVGFSNIVDAPKAYQDDLEQKISNMIKENDYFDDDFKYEAKIREGTYKKSEKDKTVTEKFIVDIDQLHYSFDVSIVWPEGKSVKEDYNISISCPYYTDVIYTDTKCVVETPYQQIKKYLPRFGRVDGVKYGVSLGQYNNEYYLKVEISACGNNTLLEDAKKDANKWIKSIYLDPNDYTIETVDICKN